MEGKWEFKSINSSIYSVHVYSSVIQEDYSLAKAVDTNAKVTAECDNS